MEVKCQHHTINDNLLRLAEFRATEAGGDGEETDVIRFAARLRSDEV